MKTKISLALVTLSLCFSAYAGGPPPLSPTPVLATNVVNNATNSVTSPAPIDVPANTVMVYSFTAVAADGGTSNLIQTFTVMQDTDWVTTAPYTNTVSLNGTNPTTYSVIIGTNIPARFVGHKSTGTSQTNAVTISRPRVLFLPTATSVTPAQ